MAKQSSLGDSKNDLVKMEEDKYEAKAADGMFRVDAGAHG